MDTPRWATRHLPNPTLPRRQATFEEVAPAGVALGDGDGVGQLGNHLLPRTSGGSSWGAQPLRAGGNPPLGGYCRDSHSPDAPHVYARLGFEPGVALPAFWGGGARANQVDSPCCFGGGPGVPDRHG